MQWIEYIFNIEQTYHTCLLAISEQCQHLDSGLHSGVQQIHLCQEHAFGAFAIDEDQPANIDIKRFTVIS